MHGQIGRFHRIRLLSFGTTSSIPRYPTRFCTHRKYVPATACTIFVGMWYNRTCTRTNLSIPEVLRSYHLGQLPELHDNNIRFCTQKSSHTTCTVAHAACSFMEALVDRPCGTNRSMYTEKLEDSRTFQFLYIGTTSRIPGIHRRRPAFGFSGQEGGRIPAPRIPASPFLAIKICLELFE